MRFKEWLNTVKDDICDRYKSRVVASHSKEEFIRLALDVNGATFLCDMLQKGNVLPYTTIIKEFGNYINGRYVYRHDKGYTSRMYCCYSDCDSIELNTTLTILLGCKTKIYAKEKDFVQVYADKNCEIEIFAPISTRVKVFYWDGAKIIDSAKGIVEFEKKN